MNQTWPAPAKLNLFLHIVGRREDGYHLLQTAFQFINLVDDISFAIREDGEVHRCSVLDGVPEHEDLVVRAAHALKIASGAKLGADISVVKRIPSGGGLGGGSSDAATTLIALNYLWKTGLSDDQLAEIGLSLGADVPVFIRGHAAWAEGVGEQLTAIEPEESDYLVIHPGCSVPTADIFGADDLTRNTPPITIRDFLERGGINDCEAVVKQKFSQVNEALAWLSDHAEARLTGTGSCLFAAFPDRESAQRVQQSLPENWQGFVVKGINRSPLRDRLEQQKTNAHKS